MEVSILFLFLFFLLGVLLVIIEIFFLPGFTITGVLGFVLLLAEIVYAYYNFGAFVGSMVLGCNILLSVLTIYWFSKSKTLSHLALHTDVDGVLPSIEDSMEGKEGITLSRLAPMGKVEIEGRSFEAKSKYGFIDENKRVVVVKNNRNSIEVELKKD